ncbi:50S ribosomal protein L15 [Lentisalinibacter orientalis]|uniref:50S ribosomal protein L15 n=1 Tax=Lentisalinibacter orientalis TaxID=2992241 RepID=UPI0038664304
MRLNTLKPAEGSKKAGKRLGRGHSAGQGKTSGRGQKGQHARSGGYHKVGFEGGQMPLQRRLPKVGFNSPSRGLSAEVRLHELAKVDADTIDLEALRKAHIVGSRVVKAKVIASGELTKAVKIKGIKVTPGARKAIEAAGGSIED